MSVFFSKCAECANLIEQTREEVIEHGLRCKAFPDCVPSSVFFAAEDVPCTDEYSFEQKEDER